MTKRRLMKMLGVLFAVSVLFSLNASPFIANFMAAKRSKVSLLFIQQAGKLQAVKLTKHCYRLTLTNLRKDLLYFSDRPNKIVGHMTPKEYLALWQHNKINPNVAVQGYLKPGNITSSIDTVLTLSQPRYNHKAGTMSYRACFTDPKQQKWANLSKLYDVTLFFDDFEMWKSY